MNRRIPTAMVALLGASAACSEGPVEPRETPVVAASHIPSCPLADVPGGAHIMACFNMTLDPGVWHGFFLAVSDAQPPEVVDGAHTRDRLNHPYVLASPEGYRRLMEADPVSPTENATAFQAEFNGTVWFDVLRLHAAADGPPQNVDVVVYWADAQTVAADITTVIEDLLAGGSLNRGQATALVRKIEQALRLLDRGNEAGAIQLLRNFIQQVDNFAAGGVLTAEEADSLIRRAQYLLEVI